VHPKRSRNPTRNAPRGGEKKDKRKAGSRISSFVKKARGKEGTRSSSSGGKRGLPLSFEEKKVCLGRRMTEKGGEQHRKKLPPPTGEKGGGLLSKEGGTARSAERRGENSSYTKEGEAAEARVRNLHYVSSCMFCEGTEMQRNR